MASIKSLITIPMKKFKIIIIFKNLGKSWREVEYMNFHTTEIPNNSEEKENTGSKQKKAKELEVTGLIREKSFLLLNTDHREFTAENEHFREEELSSYATCKQLSKGPCKVLQSAGSPSPGSLSREIHAPEYGETGLLAEKHRFRLLYIIVIQYDYPGFCCWFEVSSSCLTCCFE